MNTTMRKLMVLALLCLGIGAVAQNEFITRWDMSTSGSAATTLTLGLTMSAPVNYTWTTVPSGTTAVGTFTPPASKITGLPAGAIVRVAIDPTNVKSMRMGSTLQDRNRLVDVEQWGTVAWTNMLYMFANATNLQITATDVPNLSNVVSTSFMFSSCTSLNGPANINSWDMSHVTTITRMFSGATSFNQNIGSWNTANVTDMNTLFNGATAFNQDISAWDVSNVISMVSMFNGATSFNQNLSAWDVDSLPDMTTLFAGATAFDQDMSAWAPKLSQGVAMYGIFDNTAMSIANYDATLIAFDAYGPSNIHLGANGLKYCAAASARANMVTTKGWSIIGDAAGPGSATPAFASLAVACPGASLPALSDNGITGTWSPATVSASVSTYTFMPAAGQCAPTTTFAVTMGTPVTPAFTVATSACMLTAIPALPLTSTNGITGTWAPAPTNTATTNYTFTPDAGQCAVTTTLDITVASPVFPLFSTLSTVCEGSPLAPLPLTSNNGVTGTWLPVLNNTITTTYTFTPDSGQCGYTNVLTQFITPASVPTFTAFTSSCVGAPLTATADNGMTGTWSPTVTAANVGTYTFTPDGGQCAAVSSITVAVTIHVPLSTTVLNGGTITANETGATYQWVDCDNGNTAIANAIQQSYTPTANGNYAVIITKNGCTVTSACQAVTLSTGISSLDKNSGAITVSPNPNQGIFQLSTPEKEIGTVLIYNSLGELVYTAVVKENTIHIDLSNVAAGIYNIHTIANQKVTTHKMIIGE